MISKWKWLAYPFLVIMAIIISGQIMFGKTGLWEKITMSRARLAQQADQAEKLRAKLNRLQGLDQEIESLNLQELLQIMPANKDLPALLSEVQAAASKSGVILEGFSGAVSNLVATESAAKSDALQMKLTLTVTDLEQMRAFLFSLENSLPLVQVDQINWSAGKATVVVEGLWQSLAKLSAGANFPIPDTSVQINQIRNQIVNFSTLPVIESLADTAGVNPIPF